MSDVKVYKPIVRKVYSPTLRLHPQLISDLDTFETLTSETTQVINPFAECIHTGPITFEFVNGEAVVVNGEVYTVDTVAKNIDGSMMITVSEPYRIVEDEITRESHRKMIELYERVKQEKFRHDNIDITKSAVLGYAVSKRDKNKKWWHWW